MENGIGVDEGKGIVGEIEIENVRRKEEELKKLEEEMDVENGIRNGIEVLKGEKIGKDVILGLEKINEIEKKEKEEMRIGRRKGWMWRIGVLKRRKKLLIGGKRKIEMKSEIERMENVGSEENFERKMIEENKM